MAVRRGDRVRMIAGKDLGAEGRVLAVQPRKGKVVVEGINRVTRHEKIRPNRRGGQEGGIQHKEAPVDLSNVALICPTDGATRTGTRIDDSSGSRVRVCVKCGAEI